MPALYSKLCSAKQGSFGESSRATIETSSSVRSLNETNRQVSAEEKREE